MLKYKELINSSFFNREYTQALYDRSFDFKDAIKKEDYFDNSCTVIDEDIINISDLDDDYIFQLLDNLEESIATFEDGIIYEDFLDLMNTKGSFKKAFEDIMFSTKIIIDEKDDFIDFVNLLIENDFKDMALNYVENALLYYPSELFFQKTLKQLEHK